MFHNEYISRVYIAAESPHIPNNVFQAFVAGLADTVGSVSYCAMMGVLFRQVGDALHMHNDECDPFDSHAQHDWKSTGDTLSQ